MDETLTNKQAMGVLRYCAESERLKTLTNRELVAEALKHQETDNWIVEEMMNRLDPEWFTRNDMPDLHRPVEGESNGSAI